jgi:hypothetical protein
MFTVVKATKGQRESRNRPNTHCTGGFVGPRACLDGCVKSRAPPGFDPRTVQPAASRCTGCFIRAHTLEYNILVIRDGRYVCVCVDVMNMWMLTCLQLNP